MAHLGNTWFVGGQHPGLPGTLPSDLATKEDNTDGDAEQTRGQDRHHRTHADRPRIHAGAQAEQEEDEGQEDQEQEEGAEEEQEEETE